MGIFSQQSQKEILVSNLKYHIDKMACVSNSFISTEHMISYLMRISSLEIYSPLTHKFTVHQSIHSHSVH